MDSGINGYGIGLAQWDGTRRVSLIKQTDLNQRIEQIMRLWEKSGNDESLVQRLDNANYRLESFCSQRTSTSPKSLVPNGWKIAQPINTSGYITSSYDYRLCTWWAYKKIKSFRNSLRIVYGFWSILAKPVILCRTDNFNST